MAFSVTPHRIWVGEGRAHQGPASPLSVENSNSDRLCSTQYLYPRNWFAGLGSVYETKRDSVLIQPFALYQHVLYHPYMYKRSSIRSSSCCVYWALLYRLMSFKHTPNRNLPRGILNNFDQTVAIGISSLEVFLNQFFERYAPLQIGWHCYFSRKMVTSSAVMITVVAGLGRSCCARTVLRVRLRVEQLCSSC